MGQKMKFGMEARNDPKGLSERSESGLAGFLAIMEFPHRSVSIGKWYLEAAA